jgi:hypothetical protein
MGMTYLTHLSKVKIPMYRDLRLYGCPRTYLDGAKPEDHWMLFPLEMRDCVVFLGQRNAEGVDWGGTAFLVSVPHETNALNRHVFLFTAEHCVENRAGLVMRVNRLGGGVDVLDLPEGKKWLRHKGPLPVPEETVDAAATRLSSDEVRQLYSAGYRWVPCNMFLPESGVWLDKENQGVGIGDEVVALGLLQVFTGNDENKIIARTGNVAMQGDDVMKIMRDVDEATRKIYEKMMRLYLTELRSVSGESGSPVFVKLRKDLGEPTYQLSLFGLLIGHWYHTVSHLVGKDNLGIGQVVPAFRMKQILERDDVMAESRELELQGIG